MPLLRIIAGPVKECELTANECSHYGTRCYTRSFDWLDPCLVSVKSLRVFVCFTEQQGALVSKRNPELVEAQTRVSEALQRVGCAVTPISIPLMARAFDIWSAMLNFAQDKGFATVIGLPSACASFWEFCKWIVSFGTLSQHTLPAVALGWLDVCFKLDRHGMQALVAAGETLKCQIEDLLQHDGVLIAPTLPVPAPRHGPLPLALYFADAGATGIFNVLEFPVTAIPLGLSKEGLPLGVQAVAANGMDHNSIAVASELYKLGLARCDLPRGFNPSASMPQLG